MVVISVGHTDDKAGGLQPIEQASERHRPDVENLSERSLIDPFVLRQMRQDNASGAGHSGKLGTYLPIVTTAPRPSRLVQQPNNRVGIIIIDAAIRRLPCRASSRGLSQQMADGRFVCLVASHQLLHNWLGEELIECRLGGWEPGRRPTP